MDNMQQGNMPQGNQQQDPMDKFMHNTFWLEDRISVAFVVANPPNGAFPDDAAINEELHRKVQDLSKNIEDLGFTFIKRDSKLVVMQVRVLQLNFQRRPLIETQSRFELTPTLRDLRR